MVTPKRVIAPEIAERYGRALSTIQRVWTQHPDWPAPIGKRGRWNEYDSAAVDELVRREFVRAQPAPAGDPEQLLTVNQIADYTGLASGTIRADISRKRWPEPDDDTNGVKTWKRRTVDEAMRRRRAYNRRTTDKDTPAS